MWDAEFDAEIIMIAVKGQVDVMERLDGPERRPGISKRIFLGGNRHALLTGPGPGPGPGYCVDSCRGLAFC